MLHIFNVNNGQLIRLEELSLAAGSVTDLQTSIETETGVPVDSQLLMVSGGVTMAPSHIVCNYGAGTDTNPIFLFSKKAIEVSTAPNVIPSSKELPLQDILARSTTHGNTLAALQQKAAAAQELASYSRQLVEESEDLARTQALQGKGWYAVMQNLDRSIRSFSTHFDKLKEVVGSIQENRTNFQSILSSYKQDVEILKQLPFFDCFNNSRTERLPGSYVAPNDFSCLLDWIQAQDPNSTVDKLAEESTIGLTQYHNNEEIKSLMITSQEIIACVGNDRMRKIKGLEERLRTLHNFIRGAEEILETQLDRAKGLQQQSKRAVSANDNSILADLIDIQHQQLAVMVTNCQQLIDIRDKFYMTKQELTSNIHQRLMWVKSIENELVLSHSKSLLFIGNGKRLQKRFEILSQISQCPQIYVNCINEVVRRREYAKQFVTWSSEVTGMASSVRDSELECRRSFLEQNGHHFILSLFPGMNDLPSSFATNVKTVDNSLPELEVESVSEALTRFPRELAASVNLKHDQLLYVSTNNQMSTHEVDSTQECKKQVSDLNEQLQNLTNENEIERSSLQSKISSLLEQNQALLAQKLKLENSQNAAIKEANELRSQLDRQSESIQAYEMKIEQLNIQLENYRNEVEETSRSQIQLEEKLLMETSQQTAISQAYQHEKQRNQELESRQLMTEEYLKNIQHVLGGQIVETELGSEVHRVVRQNQTLKSSLEQVTMDVSTREGEGEELTREVNTLRANLELVDQEREELSMKLEQNMLESQRRSLEKAKLERSLYIERCEYEQKLGQQRSDLERQYRADMDNEKELYEGEVVNLRGQLSDLRQQRDTERRTSWNHKEVETIKKLAIASSPPGSDPGKLELLENLVQQHKAELDAKDKDIKQLMERDTEFQRSKDNLESRVQALTGEITHMRNVQEGQYRAEATIISQQPGYDKLQSPLLPFQALLPLSSSEGAYGGGGHNAIENILLEYKSKLYSNISKIGGDLGAESNNAALPPTSMEGSYVSLGETGDGPLLTSISKLTDEMCDNISGAKDELTKELQTNQRDLGQANSKYKYLEARYQKIRRDYKGLQEMQIQKSKEKVQEMETRVHSTAPQDIAMDHLPSEFGPTSFCVLDQPMEAISEMGAARRQLPMHLSPPIIFKSPAIPIPSLGTLFPQEDTEIAALKDFKIGDIVIFFNDNLKNYIAICTTEVIYYMHDDCLSLYARTQDEPPRSFVFGKVTSSPECCKIVKISRKRNLPVGTVFYRIKVEKYPRSTNQFSSDCT